MRETGLSILVVDDDPHHAKILKEAVNAVKLPIDLTWMESGEEALANMEKNAKKSGPTLPGLILLDVNMPLMSGFEVLRLLREKEHLRKIPVLMLSSSQSQKDIDTSYNLGANAYITKPTDFQELQHLIRNIYTFWSGSATLPFFRA